MSEGHVFPERIHSDTQARIYADGMARALVDFEYALVGLRRDAEECPAGDPLGRSHIRREMARIEGVIAKVEAAEQAVRNAWVWDVAAKEAAE